MSKISILRAYGIKRLAINAGLACFLSFSVLLGAFSTAQAGDDNKADAFVILAFGDSLTAGYGLAPKYGFTAQLQEALRDPGQQVEVINAGVSGDTSSGGRARLGWLLNSLDAPPDLVILELGANDALRGIDPAITRVNIAAMLDELKNRNIPVLLAGMLAPPNLGNGYAEEFNSIFPDLAAEKNVALYPFFLDGVAADPRLNQNDRIHPNKEGVAVIVARLIPYIQKFMDQAE